MATRFTKLHSEQSKHLALTRPLLGKAIIGDIVALQTALDEEQRLEMERDRAYWLLLRKELEELRRSNIPSEESL